MNHNVRWMTANQEATGLPDATRVNKCLKVGAADSGKPKYIWLPEDQTDDDYKSITTAQVGDVVPTIDKVYSAFNKSELMQVSFPDVSEIENGNIVPSTTTIPSFMFRNDGVERWKMGNSLDYLRAECGGDLSSLSDEEWAELKRKVMAYEDTSAAERGTRWHGAIEQSFRHEEITTLLPEEHEPFRKAWAAISEYTSEHGEKDLERSFVHPDGYGGTVDYRTGNIVMDWKTKEGEGIWKKNGEIQKKHIYPEHSLQLAGYAKGLRIHNPILVNGFIDVTTGHVDFYQHAHPEEALVAWDLMVMLWHQKINPKLRDRA